MGTSDSEGLGLSLLVYMGAILGALALLAVPVYVATKPQVYGNPPLASANPLLNGPIVGERVAGRLPVAVLQRQAIGDAESAKWLTAGSRKTQPGAPATHRTVRRDAAISNGIPVAELQNGRRRTAMFPFNLF